MKYTIRPTTKFQRDLKRIQKRGYDISLLTAIIKKIANGEVLPEKNKDHALINCTRFFLCLLHGKRQNGAL